MLCTKDGTATNKQQPFLSPSCKQLMIPPIFWEGLSYTQVKRSWILPTLRVECANVRLSSFASWEQPHNTFIRGFLLLLPC